MSETKQQAQPYSIHCENNALTVNGVTKVIEVTEREAQLKLGSTVLTVKGDGVNITRLDNDKGAVSLQYNRLTSLSFRQGSLSFKGLFK